MDSTFTGCRVRLLQLKIRHAHHYHVIFNIAFVAWELAPTRSSSLRMGATDFSKSSCTNVCRVLADPWRVCRNRGVKGRRAMITYHAMSGYRCSRIISPICSPPNLFHNYRELFRGCAVNELLTAETLCFLLPQPTKSRKIRGRTT